MSRAKASRAAPEGLALGFLSGRACDMKDRFLGPTIDHWLQEAGLPPSAEVHLVLAIGCDLGRVRAFQEAAEAVLGGGVVADETGPPPASSDLSATARAIRSVCQWVVGRCRLADEAFAFTKDLHRDYRAWALEAREWPCGEKVLSMALRAAYPGLVPSRRWHDGRQMRGFRGIALVGAAP
jgi:hypothetical protein